MRYFIFSIFYFSTLLSSTLQDAINQASAYSTIKLFKTTYKGNIIISKPLTIQGDKSIIQGDGKGTIITIKSNNVILKNLIIANSGKRVEKLDSAILIDKSNNCKILNCIIKDSLYGINLAISHNTVIKNNTISSLDNLPLQQKGSGLKIWYSNNTTIKNNKIENIKNNVVSFSHNSKFINNKFLNSMFALHFSNSSDIIVKDNIFKYNSSAIVSMGIKNLTIEHNKILSSKGAAGIGIVLGGGKNMIVKNNIIRYNAKAFYIDSKAKEKGMQRYIINNDISFNKEAFHFHRAIKNNTIKDNKIIVNISDIVKDTPQNLTALNEIKHNYWDQYAGFDRDKNNIGDTPYQAYQYSDKLWHYNHNIKFFFASPALSLINFLSKVAPFIEPNLLLEDKKPFIVIK